MPDYSKGKIYRIVGNGLTYVGSTCCNLSQRLAHHVADYSRFKKGKRNYSSSFDIIENGNYNIYLIEDYPCERREQLLMRERYFIETMDCVNKHIPILSEEEKKEYHINYKKINKAHIQDYHKSYSEINKERIKQYHHEYNIKNNEKISIQRKIYNQENKDDINFKNRIYYSNHRLEFKERKDNYYKNNKEVILKKQKLRLFLRSELKNYDF